MKRAWRAPSACVVLVKDESLHASACGRLGADLCRSRRLRANRKPQRADVTVRRTNAHARPSAPSACCTRLRGARVRHARCSARTAVAACASLRLPLCAAPLRAPPSPGRSGCVAQPRQRARHARAAPLQRPRRASLAKPHWLRTCTRTPCAPCCSPRRRRRRRRRQRQQTRCVQPHVRASVCPSTLACVFVSRLWNDAGSEDAGFLRG